MAPGTAAAAGGTAKGWGYNASGQVGNGSVSPPECYCAEVPTPLLGVTEVTEMAAGYEHGLGLLADGRVMSWGYNSDGELGDGSTTLNAVPTPVPGVSGGVAVAAGTAHSLALLGDGTVLAWGRNTLGELGLGGVVGPEVCGVATPCSKVPVRVPGISNAIAIAASEHHSVALLADGSVVGWGEDEHGEQGNGVGTATGCKCVPSATAIPGVSGVFAVAAGGHTSAALLFDGTVRNWGQNSEGQLGTGAFSPASGCACLGPVSPTGLVGVKQLSGGGDHSLALLQGGGAVGWGFNFDGQVGNGTESGLPCYCVPAPTPVLSALSDPQAVDTGEQHSAALMSDGSVRAWGSNDSGEAGNGPLGENVLSPKPVAGVNGASGLLASDYNTYAITGPSQTLRVELAGDEAGSVGGRGIICPPACTQRYPQARVEYLRAEPGARFAGFTGACSGTGLCRTKMDGDQTVTATFGRPKGTRITKVEIKRRKRLARFSFSAPGAITGYECMLVRKALRRRGAKSSKKRKPRKPRFSPCSSPRRYRNLKPGRYVFRVRALDILGPDARPAKRKFKLRKPGKPKR
jgi:alpha-tubulin suppressor-like RCC1 family protein